MRRRARVDSNHVAIVQALRAVGCTVHSLASLGKGCPDLVVGVRGRNVLMEVKAGKGVLRAAQEAWRATWRGSVLIVRTPAEAVEVVQMLDGSRGGD